MKENYANALDIAHKTIVLSSPESLLNFFLSTQKETTSNQKHIRG
jgi:hypothetical protein